jgi:hypothetical protein
MIHADLSGLTSGKGFEEWMGYVFGNGRRAAAGLIDWIDRVLKL